MSADPAGETRGQPTEDELRAAYEAEMMRITSIDMILQAAVSLLNIGGYRLGLAPSEARREGGAQSGGQGQARDLEQVRDAIDGARALLPILERRRPGELRQLRDALSQLQLAYTREAGTGAPPDGAGGGAQAGPQAGTQSGGGPGAQSQPTSQPDAPGAQKSPRGPGPAESSGRLWVPGR